MKLDRQNDLSITRHLPSNRIVTSWNWFRYRGNSYFWLDLAGISAVSGPINRLKGRADAALYFY